MSNLYACDCVSTDEGHRVTCDDPVAPLDGQLGSAQVWEGYVVAPGEEVNFPGSVSNCLLTKRGSMQSFCKRTSTINEMRVALGWKRRQPRKLGACARRRGNS